MSERKKVLVIGGSYFIGRVFSIMASRSEKFDLTVINRGKFPLNLPNVCEHHCNRNDNLAMKEFLQGKTFDATVDFCSLQKGDSVFLLEILGKNAGQYIYISSLSILEASNDKKDENAPYSSSSHLMEYIANKLSNEKDTLAFCKENNIDYTVLRPSFVYGPFNYAPRESFYFKHIFAGTPFPQPTDSTSKFNFVYVADIAKAIMEVIENEKSKNEIFNLAAPEDITYESYLETLKKVCEEEVLSYGITVSKAESENIPVPFPLDTNELYDGSKITKTLNFSYTPFEEGMKKTYNAFKPIYKK